MKADKKPKKEQPTSNFDKELVAIPGNNKDAYYFPWDRKSLSYSSTSFDSSDQNAQLTKADIQKMMEEVKKMKNYNPESLKCWKWGIPLFLVFIVGIYTALIVLCYVGPYYEQLEPEHKTGIIVAGGAFLVGVTLLGIWAITKCSTKLRRRRREHRKIDSDEIMRKVNHEIFRGKMFSARMSKHGSYIGLEHDGTNRERTTIQESPWIKNHEKLVDQVSQYDHENTSFSPVISPEAGRRDALTPSGNNFRDTAAQPSLQKPVDKLNHDEVNLALKPAK